MVMKSYKDDEFEIVLQQDDSTSFCSVSLLKNNSQVEFQGQLDFETAMEVFDYYFDLCKGNDLSTFEGYEVK
jgi:hypothetical protein